MANITFSVNEFICQSPVLNSVTYTGVRYVFMFDWISQGDYYSTFDPSTVLQLWVNINATGWQYYTDVPFNVGGSNPFSIDFIKRSVKPIGRLRLWDVSDSCIFALSVQDIKTS